MTQSILPLDIQVVQQALAWAREQPVWFCTVLKTWGSAPRSPGALMVANGSGQWCGSLSGGCVEESFLKELAAGRWREPSQVVTYGDGGLTPDTALPCGGRLDVLVEYLPAQPQTVDMLQTLLIALQGGHAVKKRLTLPDACGELIPVAYGGHPRVEYQPPGVSIWYSAPPRLIVAGWSVVAEYCVSFACAVGFEVVVCEPRPEFLAQLDGKLPAGVRLVRRMPAVYLETEGCHAHTAIVALTHDARMDDLTIMEAVNTPAFYIGAMGSARNSEKRRERLVRSGGVDEQALARLHAPVGIAIGSKTPAEIALSVITDVVAHKNRLATVWADPGQPQHPHDLAVK